MAAKVIANLIIAGGAVLLRAAVQAYKQAVVNGAKAGINAETVKAAARGSKQMTIQEARQILGVESGATWQEVTKQKYEHLMSMNEKAGSFYLQSKVYRAKEALEQDMKSSETSQ